MFFVYTSSGEGSCAGFRCAYSDYCAYQRPGKFWPHSAPFPRPYGFTSHPLTEIYFP
jgi:hypothetical protein